MNWTSDSPEPLKESSLNNDEVSSTYFECKMDLNWSSNQHISTRTKVIRSYPGRPCVGDAVKNKAAAPYSCLKVGEMDEQLSMVDSGRAWLGLQDMPGCQFGHSVGQGRRLLSYFRIRCRCLSFCWFSNVCLEFSGTKLLWMFPLIHINVQLTLPYNPL